MKKGVLGKILKWLFYIAFAASCVLAGVNKIYWFAPIMFIIFPIIILLILIKMPMRISSSNKVRNEYFAKLISGKKKFSKKELNNLFFIIENIKYIDKNQVDDRFVEMMIDDCNFSLILKPFIYDEYNKENESIFSDRKRMIEFLSKRLTKEQTNVYLIDRYINEVNNGGHEQWISNSSGMMWSETLEALKAVGLDENYKVLNEFIQKALKGNNLTSRQELAEISMSSEKYPEPGTMFRSGDVFNKLSDLRYLDNEFGKCEMNVKIKSYIRKNISKFVAN